MRAENKAIAPEYAPSAQARLTPVILPLPRSAQRMRTLALVIFGGYLIFGRTFAYVGFTGFYPGEFLLVVAAFSHFGWLRYSLESVKTKPFLVAMISVFLLWGCAEAIRGYLEGYALIDIAKGLPPHYYPLLLFTGFAIGDYISVTSVRRYFFWLTIASGIWDTAATIASNRGSALSLPWAPDVLIFSGAPTPPFCLLILAALSSRISSRFLVACIPATISLLIGGRAALLGAAGGFIILALRPRRHRFVFQLLTLSLIVGAIWIMFAGLLPNLGGRTGKATPRLVLARIMTIVDPDEAARLVEGTDADLSALDTDAGDADWRRRLWRDALDSLTSISDWSVGHGIGPTLGDLLPGENGEGYGHELRTPHNFAIYLLSYTGLIGCTLYLAILFAIIAELAKAPPSPVKDAVYAGGISVIVMALAGNVLETPFGAVPVYTVIGLLLSLAQRQPRLSPAR